MLVVTIISNFLSNQLFKCTGNIEIFSFNIKKTFNYCDDLKTHQHSNAFFSSSNNFNDLGNKSSEAMEFLCDFYRNTCSLFNQASWRIM